MTIQRCAGGSCSCSTSSTTSACSPYAQTRREWSDALRRRLTEHEQMLFGMLLAGIPRAEIVRTVGISARELAAREDVMLATLEALPGEDPGLARGYGRVDRERLTPRRAV